MDLEISKMLTVSSAHITEDTANSLTADILDLPVFCKAGYGWYISLWSVVDDESVYNELPEDLSTVIRLAVENDCMWLCIDCDGPEVENLPTYEW